MNKFKAGDEVKILRKDETFGWDSRMQQYIGKTYVLDHAYPNTKDAAGWIIAGWVWSEDVLELVESTTAFEVGDKVRCVETDITTLNYSEVYEVSSVRIDTSGRWIVYLKGFGHKWWWAKRFELVEVVAAPKVKKYTPEEVLEAYWKAHVNFHKNVSEDDKLRYFEKTKTELDKRRDTEHTKAA